MTPGDQVTVPGPRGRRHALVVRVDGSRVLVRVEGKRRGYDLDQVRYLVGPLAPPVRPVDPDLDEPMAVRSVGAVPAPLVAQPKRLTPRDASFLARLRARACDHCSATGPSDAAHYGPDRGVGLKASDYEACSLCRDCHEHWHRHGALPGLDRRPNGHEESFTRQRAGTVMALIEHLGVDTSHAALALAAEERRR